LLEGNGEGELECSDEGPGSVGALLEVNEEGCAETL